MTSAVRSQVQAVGQIQLIPTNTSAFGICRSRSSIHRVSWPLIAKTIFLMLTASWCCSFASHLFLLLSHLIPPAPRGTSYLNSFGRDKEATRLFIQSKAYGKHLRVRFFGLNTARVGQRAAKWRSCLPRHSQPLWCFCLHILANIYLLPSIS